MNERVEVFIGQQRSKNTQRAYRLDLGRWFAFVGTGTPTESDALAFRKSLSATLAPASAARAWAAVRSFYTWLGEANPLDRVKAPVRVKGVLPKVPSDAAVEKLVAAIDTSNRVGLLHMAVDMLLLNGLRAQEVCDLGQQDFYTDDGTGADILRVTGKGQKQRLVPANAETSEALLAFFATDAHLDDSSFLVHDHDGSKLTTRQVEHAVYYWAAKADLTGMHPHALRHHYATRLVRQHVNIIHVQLLMGHESPETTKRYVGLDLADLVGAARMDPRNKPRERKLRVVEAA